MKIVWAVFAHGYIIKNDVKATYSMNKLEFKIKKDENFLIQKMTRRKFLFYTLTRGKIFNSKADKTKRKTIQILTRCFFSFQNLTRCKIFNSELCFLKKNRKVKDVVFTE